MDDKCLDNHCPTTLLCLLEFAAALELVNISDRDTAELCRSSRLYCTFNNSVIKVPGALGLLAERHATFEEQLLVLLSLLPVPAASSAAASNRSFSTSCWLLLSFINSTTLSAQIII